MRSADADGMSASGSMSLKPAPSRLTTVKSVPVPRTRAARIYSTPRISFGMSLEAPPSLSFSAAKYPAAAPVAAVSVRISSGAASAAARSISASAHSEPKAIFFTPSAFRMYIPAAAK